MRLTVKHSAPPTQKEHEKAMRDMARRKLDDAYTAIPSNLYKQYPLPYSRRLDPPTGMSYASHTRLIQLGECTVTTQQIVTTQRMLVD
jgi:hypothetical protein